MIKDFKNQKGAISLFAVLSIMFFIAFMIGAYRIVSANNSMQVTALTDIQERYMKTDEEVKVDYGRIVSTEKRIPISNYKEFSMIGSNKYVLHDGKAYFYSSNKEYTYYLTNDIAFDLDREFDTNTAKLKTAEGSFIPPSVELGAHPVDAENTYKIDPGSYEIIYYKNDAKYKLLVFQNGGYARINTTSDVADKTSGKEYYGILKTYSDIANTNKYSIEVNATTRKYEYLLMYNIPNVSAFSAALHAAGITGVTLPLENNGFFPQGLYAKWEQTSSIIDTGASAAGFSLKTEGDKTKSATFGAVNINGINLNPRKISQVHFPEDNPSTPYNDQLFFGLRNSYSDANRSLNTNHASNYYPVGFKSGNGTFTLFGSGAIAMNATKVMLFVKIVQ